jgi:peptidoglycan-associated lipoprotein
MGEIEIDTVLPETPTVTTYSSDKPLNQISGTWGRAKATSLRVSVPSINLTAMLGSGGALTSEGDNWTVTLSQPLAPGKYDIVVETADKHGRKQLDASKDEIEIKEAMKSAEPVKPAEREKAVEPAAVAVAPAQPSDDCATQLNALAASNPIRFEYDRTRLIAPYGQSVRAYAELLQGIGCSNAKIRINGHADDRGVESYNQFLSDLRAEHVRRYLVRAGVSAEKLDAIGLSESQPLDPARTEDARAKNRRVEIKVIQ